ncbi:hypothetical protein DICVIV_08438 [Dictyocaulus viviparus]|uniref:alpha-L-fucosidase n=1 Tax=Dictyocaulus viviparus TaxID=29172 RepID=A0A0D8XT12_DICVI|nr:hypothetical protein DICVIV_08438 [Dictyocaulus viviparus]
MLLVDVSAPIKDVVVVNDRWGGDSMGKHGGFFTYSDHYDPGILLSRKWENCMTLDKWSWGHRRTLKLIFLLIIQQTNLEFNLESNDHQKSFIVPFYVQAQRNVFFPLYEDCIAV